MLRTRLTLLPGANGTKKLVARYGDRLVCVRYRYDPERRKRLKTVELIEEEHPWEPPAPALYLVQIGYEESELRARIKAAGARWNPEKKTWLMTAPTLRRLGLESRVVSWLEPTRNQHR